MTVTLEITELSKYAKCIEYINGVEGHITVKMVSKHCNGLKTLQWFQNIAMVSKH